MTLFEDIQFSTEENSLLQFIVSPEIERPRKSPEKLPTPSSPMSAPFPSKGRKNGRGRPSKAKTLPAPQATPAPPKIKQTRLQKSLRPNIITVIKDSYSILSDCVRAWPKKLKGKKKKPPTPPYKPVELNLSEEERWRSYGKEFPFYIPPDIVSCFG